MIDTHTHLDSDEFKSDRDDVIARFFRMKSALHSSARRSEVGVVSKIKDGAEPGQAGSHKYTGRAIITIGVDKKSNKEALKIANSHEKIFATVSYHPEEGGKVKIDDAIVEVSGLSKHQRVVAIGEIGLDYFKLKDLEEKRREKTIEQQKELFIRQIEIAKKRNLPIVIHCRDAYADLYKILKSKIDIRKLKIVIHCYGGNIEDTERFLGLNNVHFSFTGNITFSKSEKEEIFEAIKMIPLKRIMVETDSPLLTPVPHRGKRNEPCYVKYVLTKVAKARGMSAKEIEQVTDKNAISFFNLPI